jgi:hypothetical protein
VTAFTLPAAAPFFDLAIAPSNSMGAPVANVTQVKWTDPTSHTDGTPLATGEVVSYTIGVRQVSGAAGIYPFTASAPATATSELLSLLVPILPTGVALVAAAQAAASQGVSAWSAESAPFTLLAQVNPPTGVVVA